MGVDETYEIRVSRRFNEALFTLQSKINFAEVLCKNRYVGRTFIQPSTRLRQLGVAKKFGALSENVKGKRIILVDDSIVRGNTIGPIIKLLRDAGAKEVSFSRSLASTSSCCCIFLFSDVSSIAQCTHRADDRVCRFTLE